MLHYPYFLEAPVAKSNSLCVNKLFLTSEHNTEFMKS